MLKAFIVAVCSSIITISASASPSKSFGPNIRFCQDWIAVKNCTSTGCFWKGITTKGPDSFGFWFNVYYFPGGKFNFAINAIIQSEEKINLWKNQEKDFVRAKVRIDKGEITETILERQFDIKQQTLFLSFYPDDFGTDFLNSLKSGKILKVRIYSNNEGYTIPFSLKGSAEAINFIQKNIAKTIDTDDWGDEPPNQP